MIEAIILAAGMSKRMGKKNKLLLKINEHIILKQTVVNIINADITNCILVLGYEYKKILPELKDLKVNTIINDDYKEGMASSIRKGVKNLHTDTKGVMVCLADMPLIKSSTYNKMISIFNKNDSKRIILPLYNNIRGNPIIFSHHYFDELIKLEGDFGAKKLIVHNEKHTYRINLMDKGIISDFDNIEQYYSYISKINE